MLNYQAMETTNLTPEEIRVLEKLHKRIKDKYQGIVSNIVVYGSTLKDDQAPARKDINVLLIMPQKDSDHARDITELAEALDRRIKLDPKVLSLEEYATEAQYETSFYRKVTTEGVEVYKNGALLEAVSL